MQAVILEKRLNSLCKLNKQTKTKQLKQKNMKKIIYPAALGMAMLVGSSAFAQMQDEKNVTITMDLQPILQLNMTTPDHIDFVFDQIPTYIAGITKYGATTLKVSSTVDWDLWAVGTATNGGAFWDQQAKYGIGTATNAIDNIPLQALELHQNGPNNQDAGQAGGLATDYSNPFAIPVVADAGLNNIYAAALAALYTAPAITQKYICGGIAATDFGTGGSYLTTSTAPGVSDFYYIIDYRIVPGLPAIFPMAKANLAAGPLLDLVTANMAGAYAQPGIYTMDVKYVLMENQ